MNCPYLALDCRRKPSMSADYSTHLATGCLAQGAPTNARTTSRRDPHEILIGGLARIGNEIIHKEDEDIAWDKGKARGGRNIALFAMCATK